MVFNLLSAVIRRLEKGRASVERERLISAEEGILYSPLHSRGYFIMAVEEDGQVVLREAKHRFRRVLTLENYVLTFTQLKLFLAERCNSRNGFKTKSMSLRQY